MFNKLSENYKKRHIYNYEDEPPEKKLISDGDILIKQLAKKQMNTQVNLEEQLATKNNFYKSTEEVSVTSYTSGSLTLENFNSVLEYSDSVEKLKSCGLSNEEIQLFFDLKNGKEYLKDKHKNMNESVLKYNMVQILNKMKESKSKEKVEIIESDRLDNELTLATKPTSIETKLLKFALENQKTQKEKLPSAMDQIKDVERQLMKDLSPPDIKKIRKKARRLTRQIETIKNSSPIGSTLKELKPDKQAHFPGVTSKWDVKEIKNEIVSKESKVYTCKPQNLYTIRDGQIVKLNSTEVPKNNESLNVKDKLSLEEIKKIPKFENYDRGIPSKILYLKNLANGIVEQDLRTILTEFCQSIVSIHVMKGRMRGQAFVEFSDEHAAERVLNQYNGIIVKNKPIIIQFGKGKCS